MYTDHFVILLEVDSSLLSTTAFKRPRKRKREETSLAKDTELDKLLIQTLNVGKDEMGKKLRLYGPVHIDTPPVKIVIHGACKNAGKHTATEGAGVYFGFNSPKNCSLRVWGNQSNARCRSTEFGAGRQNIGLVVRDTGCTEIGWEWGKVSCGRGVQVKLKKARQREECGARVYRVHWWRAHGGALSSLATAMVVIRV
ncbi:hypothetical protein B0H10DRAFT_2194180 [Mycena sp. CBHHK59/15]|nr:hypothetical protein B0H10DRAFT_2194180 [Mycena sp. CBHHK59/15]